jgi:hypothetical protein
MFELLEPIAMATFSGICNDRFLALGCRSYWDGYFAGRAAPLGDAPAEVVDAVFYNFAPGEVARHIPRVWSLMTPAQALETRERGSADALRHGLGDFVGSPGVVRAGELAVRAGSRAPTEGRALYAGLRAVAVPEEPVARLWHGATLLREHRGDGHNIALAAHGIGRTEAHVLLALSLDMRAEDFGRVSHLPGEQLAAVVDGLRERGLVTAEGRFTDAGRERKASIEALTDELAAPAYDALSPAELDELVAALEPLSAAVAAADL